MKPSNRESQAVFIAKKISCYAYFRRRKDMLKTANLYQFPGATAELSEVGGKAHSLMRMAEAKLPVPPGFVLPVAFFEDWFQTLRKSPAWAKFADVKDGTGAVLQQACDALKDETAKLAFDAEQKKLVLEAAKKCAGGNDKVLFAVRSSSPEEDLAGSSFAGGYETILGVTTDKLEDAVRRAFASCLDVRVAVYKAQHGFNVHKPSIAVVVQMQIASEVAGVGFSLNPVTNNYDEAVFNANWGLGETVVAGLATPDTFVVNKVTGEIVQKQIGGKETSIWLLPTGGTEERKDSRCDQPSLTDDQVAELARMVDDVDNLYGCPMDTEWAWSGGKLYLLQGRPITTQVQLPPDLVTEPGKQKRLYLDATISVQGLYEPISVMGTSFIKRAIGSVSAHISGKDYTSDVENTIPYATAGRLYINMSNAFALAGKEHVTQLLKNMDHLAAKAIESISEEEYRSQSDIKRFNWHLLWTLPEPGLHVLEARLLPEHAHRQVQQEVKKHIQSMQQLSQQTSLSFKDYASQVAERTAKFIFTQTLPLFIASRVAFEKMKGATKDEQSSATEFEKLERSLPNNPTVEMGLALYHVSQLAPENVDLETFKKRLSDRTLPQEFLEAWDEFIKTYGHRGALELDMKSPRYRDNHEFLLDQVLTLRESSTAEDNPQARFDKNQQERHAAFERLCERIHSKGWLTLQRFNAWYRVYENLSGYREMHKFLVILGVDLVRQRVLQHGAELLAAGRIDSVEQVFDLTIDDLDSVLSDKKIDAKVIARVNRTYPDKLKAVSQLPTIFDSRGKIIRPPAPPVKPGEVAGTPISAGIARGKIKVLHTPDEKPLERGEILVARATDPGWTPLFVNAAAVILEIGGMLQHGALVAREYGLPCVAGVAGATEIWEDGTMVEVDGSAGIIRKLD